MGEQMYPSLFLAAASVGPEGRTETLRLEGGLLRIGNRVVDVDYRGRFLLRFPGPAYRTFSAVDVLASARAEKEGRRPAFPSSLFKDKVVIIGMPATGRGGHREVTPPSVRTPRAPRSGLRWVIGWASRGAAPTRAQRERGSSS